MALVSSGVVATPLVVNWDVIPGESLKQLQVHQIQYTNNSDEDAELGWGEMLPVFPGLFVNAAEWKALPGEISGEGPDQLAKGTLDLTADVILTRTLPGTSYEGDTFTVQVLAAAANPTDTVLVAFTGTAAAIICTVTPNDGTNNGATPVDLTTAELSTLINSGAVVGKTVTVTDSSNLRIRQTATGGGATALAAGGEGDGVAATFGGGFAPITLSFPKQANVVGFNIATAASAAIGLEYWDGLAWAALTPEVEPDFDATGVENLIFAIPSDWALGGGKPGHYSLKLDAGNADLIITSVKAGRILDKVGVVPTLNAGVMNYPIRPLGLMGSKGLFSYAIQTDDGVTTSNEVIVDYESI